MRGDDQVRTSGAIDLLLDGQQRVTSLYTDWFVGGRRSFFDGDGKAFTDLYFSLADEEFEFFAPVRMRNNPLWVNVVDLLAGGNSWISELTSNPEYSDKQGDYLQRGLKVGQILNIDLPVQQMTGEDKTTDVVVDIFNRVNSGGTKLSKGDLALARIGARWPAVRAEMQQRLAKWETAGFSANLDWLLRCMNAVVTNNSEFERLEPETVGIANIRQALYQTETAVDRLLEAMRSHLHMDIDRVYSSKQAFPVMVRYLVNRGGRFPDQATLARLLHWYVSVAIWGRFSGPVETVINQDLGALAAADPLEALLRNLRQSQGDRVVTHENFDLNYNRARFYPMLYTMSRIQDARDWGTGGRLRHHGLGDHTNLELHHIFPKAYLRRNHVSASDANNLGNIAFQTRETNRRIGSTPPAEYMPEVASDWPGALASQWIPMSRELWQVENYHEFLEARRRLLAAAANEMLAALQNGIIPPAEVPPQTQTVAVSLDLDLADPDDEAIILSNANRFTAESGLPAGETAYEIADEDTGELIALDLAWPEGLQIGYSRPVALLIDEDDAVRRAANGAGFRVFTSLDDFQRYVERDILAEAV